MYGGLDILVNNAAAPGTDSTNMGQSLEDWDMCFKTNVIGTVAVTQAFIPQLQKSLDGKIVVVSSSMGSLSMCEDAPKHPLSIDASPYRASKAAINMVMIEWTKVYPGVKIWGIDPGLCATRFAGEYSLKNGRDPKEGADIARQCIEGEREDCVGKVVFEQYGETGVRPW